jgi:predicted transcriptional regulator
MTEYFNEERINELVIFFKALADPNRLRIAGLLAERPLTVEQMAMMLDVRPSTVSHHLQQLAAAGLVSARAEGYYNLYALQPGALEAMARRLLSGDDLAKIASDVDTDAYDRKVAADYSYPDGRLKTIPAQRKKLEAVLRHVVKAFEPDRRYSEKETNELLSRFHNDTASLRRELVGYKLLGREGGGGEYWRL